MQSVVTTGTDADTRTTLVQVDDEDLRYWSADELALFVTQPSVGRILCVHPGAQASGQPGRLERCLREANYQVGRLAITRELTILPRAAATFVPDLIYVTIAAPEQTCVDAMQVLSEDPRTRAIPLIALCPSEIPASVVEAAYAKTGCDFFRFGQTTVELLARTQLLIKLIRASAGVEPVLPARPPRAANEASGARLDLYDPHCGAYSATYFVHRLPSEISRARRYGRNLSLLAIRCVDAERDSQNASCLVQIVRSHIRTADLVARIEPSLFCVLLPETAVNDVAALQQRAGADLRAAGVSHSMGAAGLDEDGGEAHTPTELIHLAAKRCDA